jgi:hypothetical protein
LQGDRRALVVAGHGRIVRREIGRLRRDG